MDFARVPYNRYEETSESIPATQDKDEMTWEDLAYPHRIPENYKIVKGNVYQLMDPIPKDIFLALNEMG